MSSPLLFSVPSLSEVADALRRTAHKGTWVGVNEDRLRVVDPELDVVGTVTNDLGGWTLRTWVLGQSTRASAQRDFYAEVLAAEVLWAEAKPSFREDCVSRHRCEEVLMGLLGLDPDPHSLAGMMVYPPPVGPVETGPGDVVALLVWKLLIEAHLASQYGALLDRCPGLVLTYVETTGVTFIEAEGQWHGYSVYCHVTQGEGWLKVGDFRQINEDNHPHWESRVGDLPIADIGEEREVFMKNFATLAQGLERAAYPYLFQILKKADGQEPEGVLSVEQEWWDREVLSKTVVWAPDEETARKRARLRETEEGVVLTDGPVEVDARSFPEASPRFVVRPE